ncbi:MAG: hypothetical protein AB7O64_18235 [Methylibium sp.]
MLARIATLLLALADLAERAASAAGPVRCLVLWALSRADSVAKEFVADTAGAEGHSWSPPVLSVRYGFEPADAIDLAMSLRVLALLIGTMAEPLFDATPAEPGHPPSERRRRGDPRHDRFRQVGNRAGAMIWPVQIRDTS